MIVFYLILLWCALIFWLRSTWMTDCLFGNRLWRRHPIQSVAEKGRRNSWICVGLSVLYFAVMMVAIVVPIQLAKNPNIVLSKTLAQNPWAGSYVILDCSVGNGTTGLTYSRSGESLGNTSFEYFQGGWSVRVSNGSRPLVNIIYNNAMPNQTYPKGTRFSATCKNYTESCTTGGLWENPVSILNDSNINSRTPEFNLRYLTLDITSRTPQSFLNISSNSTTAWTANQWYQGIGHVYAPLGYWVIVGTNPIIEVMWSPAPFAACQGLGVFLSEDYEGIAWLVFGLIWQWWMAWGDNGGGCINWANNLVDVGPTWIDR